MQFLTRITNKFNRAIRILHNRRSQEKLLNRNLTLLSSNCTGAFILHDLNVRFNSPFVNLYLTPKDFIRYLKNIEFYQQQALTFIQTGKPYPVANLANLTIHFMHYHSEQEAAKKWQERTARMNLEQLFIIMSERDGCTYQDLVEFDNLAFSNKVVFTYKVYPELKSAVHISGFEDKNQLGDLYEYVGLTGKRHYDKFDYVRWFNQMD
ncbi:uncharacterized protein (DUF1919 family) [Nicoletella semolina]|uniref:Uncharacterized protein (DUF1919 family) n=1 Tax=Nicoletella semolina TaxID=271160 RepID=A0A4R2NAG0_9PAST|nr:DUF1919 domain-containing protein [Nicoletella semolina]MDH2923942.1 exopolysaccharide biosynthesis protein [Nicoletella semolina]TCP18063.1 uncharacterized protein (DUF1919 family) [Nicoletella semolina]